MRPSRSSPRWLVYLLSSLLFAFLLFTVLGERGVFHLWRLRGEKIQLDEKNFALQKENDALRDRVDRIRSDDRYLEKLAREELGLIRQGEMVYRFAPSDSKRNKGGVLAESSPEKAGPSR